MLEFNFIGMLKGETKRWSAGRIVKYLIRRTLLYLIVIGGALLFALPLFLMISTSLKSSQTIYIRPFQWIPRPPHFENYVQAWTTFPFTRYAINTIFITVSAMFGAVISTSLAAYALARLKFPARIIFFTMIIGSMLLPREVTFIPTYLVWWRLGFVNTFVPLIAPSWLARGLARIFLLRQFFRTIPMELEDSASIDGAGAFQRFVKIIVPLSKPAIGVVMIFEFISHWNSFVQPLVYLNDPKLYTLNVGLNMFKDAYGQQFASMPTMHWFMAIATIIVVPILVIFVFLQRYFVEGINLSGMKR